ncbi:MAG TPA: hypothetical protein VEA63_13940, partial [Opitutus sp.]|nr:hypothetical protein [Opitutus sp.]
MNKLYPSPFIAEVAYDDTDALIIGQYHCCVFEDAAASFSRRLPRRWTGCGMITPFLRHLTDA